MKKILEKNSSAPNFDFFKIPAITGIKAEFIEPSANNLLNKFGSLNDIKKASDTKPAPIIFAINKSLTYPRILLKMLRNLILKLL